MENGKVVAENRRFGSISARPGKDGTNYKPNLGVNPDGTVPVTLGGNPPERLPTNTQRTYLSPTNNRECFLRPGYRERQ